MTLIFACVAKRLSSLPSVKRGKIRYLFTAQEEGVSFRRVEVGDGGSLSLHKASLAPLGSVPGVKAGDCGFLVCGREDKPVVLESFRAAGNKVLAGYVYQPKGTPEHPQRIQAGAHTDPEMNDVARGFLKLVVG